MKSIDMILYLTEGLKQSLENYEKAAKAQNRRPPVTGYLGNGELTREDTKENIQRRIIVIRDELLKLSKSL